MTREEFLRQAWEAARGGSKSSGLPAAVTVAQAALESNWGESGLSREANNYFGLKAHGGDAWVEMPTTECGAEGAHKTRARFAKYGSMAECFEDRDRLIATSATYAEAKACAGEVEKFVRALAKHWATDPKYAEKLLRMVAAVTGKQAGVDLEGR